MNTTKYSYIKKYNGEPIKDDSALTVDEKEVIIRIEPRKNTAYISSDKSTITRYLINHPEAKIQELRKLNDTIAGGMFKLPLSCLTIKKKPRTKNQLSQVISK